MSEVDKMLSEMMKSGTIQIFDIRNLIKEQLKISKGFVKRGDYIGFRIAAILIDNTLEIFLRNINFSIRSVRFDYDGEIDTHKEKNFNDLIADLFSAGEIDNFQKLIFIFFHQVRNVFYHKGIPLEIEQPLKIPSSTNTLLKIYFNLVCDLIIKFAESLPFRAGDSHYEYQQAINKLKFDEVRTNYFIPGVKIILKFLSNKWILLISMIEFITKVSSMPTTDMHFKWSEFFLKGGKKGKPYKFETQEKVSGRL